ncbi:MAG: CHAT domain-containing tetratricopeptide repeat protein [Burkholderiales bacterium]
MACAPHRHFPLIACLALLAACVSQPVHDFSALQAGMQAQMMEALGSMSGASGETGELMRDVMDLQRLTAQGKTREAKALQERIEARTAAIKAQQPAIMAQARQIKSESHEYNFHTPVTLYHKPLTIDPADPSTRTRGADIDSAMRMMEELAEVGRVRGDVVAEEAAWRRIVAMRESTKGHEHPEVSHALGSLAEVHLRKGDPRAAEPLYRRAVAIMEKSRGPAHPDTADALDHLAEFHLAQGDLTNAETLTIRSFSIRERSQDMAARAASINNLGVIRDRQGHAPEAMRLFEQAFAHYEEAVQKSGSDFGARRGAAVVQSNIGVMAWKRNDVSLALARLADAHERSDHLLWTMMDIMSETQQIALMDGIAAETNALIAFQQGAARVQPAAARLALTIVLQRKGRVLESLGRLNQDARAMPVTTNVRRDADIGDAEEDDFFGDGPGAKPVAVLIEELAGVRSRIANQRLNASRAVDPVKHRAEIVEMERLERALQAKITDRTRRAQQQRGEDERKASRTERRQPATREPNARRQMLTPLDSQALLRQIAATRKQEIEDARQMWLRGQPNIVADVQRALPPDAALLELALYRPFDPGEASSGVNQVPARYVAYVLLPNGNPTAVDLGEAAAIDRLVATMRRAMMQPTGTGAATFARRLDQILMRPIRPLLGAATHLFISPEATLHTVPFGALRDETDRYLIQRYTLTYLTSGRDLLRPGKPIPARSDALIIADPAFGAPTATVATASPTAPGQRSVDLSNAEWESLPGTATEARAIHALWPSARLLTGRDATETALKQVRGPRILHVASHGFFLPDQRDSNSDAKGPRARENPLLRSGLVLAGANGLAASGDDGILTALEAASLDLSGTGLVVLSACETGLGEIQNGEGVYGLRRALSIAGAQSQVISLWKVADDATSDLMVELYRRLQAGTGRSAALREAQLKLLADRNTSHPFFWAGFIASGEWRSLATD